MELYTCTKCNKPKLLSEFNKDKGYKSGFGKVCKKCESIRNHNGYIKRNEAKIAKRNIKPTDSNCDFACIRPPGRFVVRCAINSLHKCSKLKTICCPTIREEETLHTLKNMLHYRKLLNNRRSRIEGNKKIPEIQN